MKNIKSYNQFLNETSTYEYSENVLKWSHIWTPNQYYTIKEKYIINTIFEETQNLIYDSTKNAFIINNLNISGWADNNSDKLHRLTFLPPLIIRNTFDCSWNILTSLEGGPIEAKNYWCLHNNLKNLKGGPKKCEMFDCSKNIISTLKHGPVETISYNCSYNKLKDLKGAPIKCNDFACTDNPLTDFKVYAKPYMKYDLAKDVKLTFIDPEVWPSIEEYKANNGNINISNSYL